MGEIRAQDRVAWLGTWSCGALILCPPVAFIFGRLLAAVWPTGPPVILGASWMVAVCCAAAIGWWQRARIRELVECGRLDRVQWALLLLFVAVVTGPRLVGLDAGIPVVVYDDHWHLQKMASVTGSFPDLRHFLFPDLRLSYYFYSYLPPSAAHALAPQIPLRVVWAVFVGVTTSCVWLFTIVVLNPQLGDSRMARRGFAVGVTLLGGLHEWPWLLRIVAGESGEMHTEWWARSIGVNAQVASPYSTAFWAPQHALGLAVFVVIYRMLRGRREPTVRAGLLSGVLLGVLLGFSVYVGLSAALYMALWFAQLLRRSPGRGLAILAAAAGGCAAAVAPILGFLAHRSGNVSLAADWATIRAWPLFLVAELVVLLPLFVAHAAAGPSREVSTDRRRDVAFVAVLFLMPMIVRSEGINVISYRAVLPAQIVLLALASAGLEHLRQWPGWTRWPIVGLAVVQAAAFIPETVAMTALHIEALRRDRIPETILQINTEMPLDHVVEIPFQPGVSIRELSGNVLHIHRMKDLDRAWYCADLVEQNHLVYLNRDGLAALESGCLRP